MDAVVRMADVLLAVSKRTADDDSIGCAKIVVFCNVPEDNPFMAGALHGSGEPEVSVNVAISGPGVVRNVVAAHPEASLIELADLIKRTTFKITRVGELIAREASEMLDAQMGIIDLSLAPTPAVGDSIAEILQSMGLEQPGAPGTTAALAMLNDAVKKGGTMATSSTGGLSGAFIPVSEDAAMARAAADGVLSIEKLEAMTAVCSLGLDMIVVPGDTPRNALAGVIADVMAIGMINEQDDGRAPHPGLRQEGRRLGDAGRSLRRGPGHGGEHVGQRRLRRPRRPHPGAAPGPHELAARRGRRAAAQSLSPRIMSRISRAVSCLPSARQIFSASVSWSTASMRLALLAELRRLVDLEGDELGEHAPDLGVVRGRPSSCSS